VDWIRDVACPVSDDAASGVSTGNCDFGGISK
jgi:hypothetical protein